MAPTETRTTASRGARTARGEDEGMARLSQRDGGDAPVRRPPARAGGAVLYDGCMSTETLTEEDVYEALEEVIDPELGLDFVSLGLVYDVEIEGPEVFITFTLTTPACPIGPQVSEQMREFVGDLPGVEKVHPKMIFDPPWSPEMMSEDAKFALGF
jgi:metal-sulfur cluster biosynthetic enzyme